MGGKTQTSTQQVTIPPEVMARYNAVNTRAENTAQQPFLQYSQDPNAFVAPLTGTQRAGIYNTNQAAGMSQPYFDAATGMTFGGAQGVGPLTQQQIGYYQNPFTQSVVDSTLAGLQQQQGQQRSQQQSEAIKSRAFGGDRAGMQRAQLMGQQGLATAQAISPLYQRGYEQALQAAQGQQGVRAADLQRQLAAGQQLGGLGAAAQQSALAGAQAQLGAGTAEQQTQQAGMQAIYNQFLQERGYPFQIAQFLANIAMGTGALSGSTTTTQQPAPFFSDEREKTNVQPLGEGMYAYDYTDDVRRAEEEGRPMPPKRVGPMAQDIEERAPGLVGEIGGHKVVDAEGGLGRLGYQSMGGMVSGPGAYATGGSIVGSEDMRSILAAIGQPLEFYGGKGLYGGATKGGAGSPGYVPQGQIGTPKLVTAGGMPRMPESGLSQAAQTGSQIADLLKMGQSALVGSEGVGGKKGSRGLIGSEGSISNKGYVSGFGGGRPGPSTAEPPAPKGADKVAEALKPVEYPNQYAEAMPPVDPDEPMLTARGGFMRPHYDLGGSLPYGTDDQGEDPLGDVLKEGSAQQRQLATPGKAPAPTPGLGSELMQLGSLAKSAQGLSGMLPAGLTEGISGAASGIGSGIAGLGTAAAEGIGAIGSGLAAGGAELLAMLPLLVSDERMKDNIEPVGELYDGQPIYRYNMKGSPKTQLGLMAQDVERNGHSDAVAGLGGIKMVDYKRATDVAAGLAGRRGYATEGFVEEESLPMLLAALQERAPEERRAPGLGPVTMSDADPVPLIRSREPEMERKPEMEREPGLVIAQARTPDQPGVAPVRSDEPRAGGVVPAPRVATPASTVVAPPTPPARPEEVGDLSPQALRAYTAERARALGIDPNFATAVFQGESGFRANARGDGGSSFNVAQLHYGNVSDRYPRSGLGDVFTRETGLDARDPNNARAVIDWSLKHAAQNGWNAWTVAGKLKAQGAAGGSGAPAPGVAGGQRPIGGVVPPEQIPSRSPISTLVRNATGVEGAGTPVQQALMSENFWVPALAGLGSMLASKSPYLASAVGEGLVGGTAAYTGLQKQQSATDLEKSQSALTGIEAASKAIRYGADGRPQAVLVSDGRGGVRWVPFYQVLNDPDAYNLSPATRAEMEEAARRSGTASPPPLSGGTGQPAASGTTQPPTNGSGQPAVPSATGQPTTAGVPENVIRTGAIEIPKEGAYSINVAPAREGPATSYIASTIRAAGGEGVNLNNPRAVESFVSLTPQLTAKAETDKKTADQIVARARQLDRNISDLWQLATSVNKISRDKFTQQGAGQEYRVAIANMYNTAARLAGVPGLQIDVGRDVDEAQIIQKLQALASPQMAQQSGFHASSIANSISNAMPRGNMNQDAANTIIASMMVDMQRDRDFNRYYSQYINRFGTPLGVYESFNNEMGDRYAIEKNLLKKSMEGEDLEDRGPDGRLIVTRSSPVEYLRNNPDRARQFDQAANAPGLARYWREN